jgi:transaldolase
VTPGRIYLDLPAQPWLYALGAQLVADGRQVAFTAVYDAGQAVCAVTAGDRWIIPNVDRASRLDAVAGPVVPRLAPVVTDDVVLLTASIKSPAQALEALTHGARAVTTT